MYESRSLVPSSPFPCTLTFDLGLIQMDNSFLFLCLPLSPSPPLSPRSYLLADSWLSIPEHISHFIVAARVCVRLSAKKQ